MINLATIVSLVVPVLLVFVVDRATVRLRAHRRRDATEAAAELQSQRTAAIPVPHSPRVAGADHASADVRSVA
jgi:hypothetical protein